MTLPESDDTNQKLSNGNSRKLFVGGLHWSTTEKSLEDYMTQYGMTEYVKIVYDNYTGRSRGFGFIKFMDDSTIEKVINNGPHFLNDKKIDPKPALPITTDAPIDDLSDNNTVSKKIFVGGLKHDLSDDSIHNYFGSFGTIAEIKFYYQKNTNMRRGFCFVEYEEMESAQKALESRYHKIDNETVEVKIAQRRPVRSAYMKNMKMNPSYNNNFLPYYDYSPYYYVDQPPPPHNNPYNSLYYVMPYYYNIGSVSPATKDSPSQQLLSPNQSNMSPSTTPRASKSVSLPVPQQ